MTIQLREYTERDYRFVRALFEAYVAEERARVEVLPWEDSTTDSYLEDLVGKSQEQGGVVLIAAEGEARCGFIAAMLNDHQAWDRTNGKSLMVMELHVHPDHRRRGVGRLLFEEVERRFASQGVEWSTLGTFVGNRSAQAFYSSMGYRPMYIFMGKPLTNTS